MPYRKGICFAVLDTMDVQWYTLKQVTLFCNVDHPNQIMLIVNIVHVSSLISQIPKQAPNLMNLKQRGTKFL